MRSGTRSIRGFLPEASLDTAPCNITSTAFFSHHYWEPRNFHWSVRPMKISFLRNMGSWHSLRDELGFWLTTWPSRFQRRWIISDLLRVKFGHESLVLTERLSHSCLGMRWTPWVPLTVPSQLFLTKPSPPTEMNPWVEFTKALSARVMSGTIMFALGISLQTFLCWWPNIPETSLSTLQELPTWIQSLPQGLSSWHLPDPV